VRIGVRQVRAFLMEHAHHIESGRLTNVIDVALVGDPGDEDV
jgi:hypothetical protein